MLKLPLRWGIRMTGHKGVFLREYPHRDAYLLREARLFHELTTSLILLGGGITNRTTATGDGRGFEFNAMYSGAAAEPTWSIGSRTKRNRWRGNTVISAWPIYRRTHCVVTGP